ncbi:mxaA protein [Paraburkholderia caballeronis]|nr:mxaA protein [Paraburkholderia caballeronis]TDV22164.1 mxaA protein [Paraburkholderia caballeronis]TDV29068.1 mxaA protein [Paraburkholderia caballeronis]
MKPCGDGAAVSCVSQVAKRGEADVRPAMHATPAIRFDDHATLPPRTVEPHNTVQSRQTDTHRASVGPMSRNAQHTRAEESANPGTARVDEQNDPRRFVPHDAIESRTPTRSFLKAATFALAVASSSCAFAAAAPTIEPRAFGYVLGDVLTQRVRIDDATGDIPPTALPSSGRVGIWLERRPSRMETGADRHRWLVLDYQVTNAPQTLTTIELPALTLNLRSGPPLRIDAWPVSIGPLTPDAVSGSGDLQPMRPDRLPPRAPIAQLERRLGLSLGALALVLIAWAAWWGWRNRRESARLPFARAWRDLQPANADDPAAWRRLHRALDETAGRVVQHGSVAALLAHAPWLEPLHAQLEQFYRQSAARFFATADPIAPYPLKQLAHALYLAERRHQR